MVSVSDEPSNSVKVNMEMTESFNSSVPATVLVDASRVKDYLPNRELYSFLKILAAIFYSIGIFGNSLAFVILSRKKTAKNSKYTFMLRCLLSNNLIGLLGMLTSLVLTMTLPPETAKNFRQGFCGVRVVWRFFGLSSGCIAGVMAAERWMALARPFIYHKHITYNIVRKAIISLIAIAALVTFPPLFGWGIYYDEKVKVCKRYREAKDAANISYAYVFMVFGIALCTVIVCCNFFVTRVLYLIGRSKTRRQSSTGYSVCSGEKGALFHQNSYPPTTSSDEIRFAKLMTYLSITFVVCWMPQMISIPLAQSPHLIRPDHWFFHVVDLLLVLHFTSDPYVYVVTRTKQTFISNCVKKLRKSSSINRSQSVLRPTMETLDYGMNNLT